MPPRIPVRFPWTSSRPTIPSTTANGTLLRSGFSSTPTSLVLGPESPNYIEVPKTVQPTYPPKPIVKGHLPIPRDVFKTRSAKAKESDAFIDASTKGPKKQKVPGPYTKDAEYRLYKQRLAESRKEALRSGVKELHERKVSMEAAHLSKIQKIGAFRRKVAMAPPREVDVLTQTSMTKGMRDFLADKLPFSSKANISQGRCDAYARRMEKQQAIREARLHDLYTNARTFIVNEEQLDEAIESAFGTEAEPMGWDVRGVMVPNGEGHSPFHGPTPESVGDMLEKLRGGEGVGLAKERVKKLAEELTGGKM